MRTETRNAIYECFFNDGTLTAVDDVSSKVIHPLLNIKNLYVLNAMKSLVSRGYAKKMYAWRTHYWTITDAGIDYIRKVSKSLRCRS